MFPCRPAGFLRAGQDSHSFLSASSSKVSLDLGLDFSAANENNPSPLPLGERSKVAVAEREV